MVTVKKISKEDWEKQSSLENNPWVKRVLANLEPIGVVNNILYVKYCGTEDKKKLVFEYFLKLTPELNKFSLQFGANFIKSAKDINEVKLYWLENLIEKFKPNKIDFNLK